ncbi:S-layer homology domain-containing protein [Peptococcus simiae]|uniref:S-layer homology domain-containing protein n=1 Tax=Peptococcus simiae TaxID=1643805 RepID=A0ABW9GZH7_9FIRM
MADKKGNTKGIVRKTVTISLAAALISGPIFSDAAVWAKDPAPVILSAGNGVNSASTNTSLAYPANIVNVLNWDKDEMSENDVNYWGISQANPKQKLVRVTTSDPIEIVDFTYEGTFVDEEGRTNLRLSYMEKSAAVSAVWKQALFRFDDDLYNAIDWEKSVGVTEKGEEYKFTTAPGKNEKLLSVAQMIATRTQNKNNLPINLVLKEGVNLNTLGKKNYLIQMRLVDAKNQRIYAFAPGKSSLDYSTYTRTTSVSLEDKIDTLFKKGPMQKKGDYLAVQRSFLSEFIANPDGYADSSNLGLVRTQYQGERGSAPGNTTDDKPTGFAQVFDARFVEYFKEDPQGNIAYTNLLKSDRTEYDKEVRVPIKKEDINYSPDGKLAYIVIGESNFTKDGVKVVSVDKMNKKISLDGFYFTAIDYVVDKEKFQETFQTTGTTKVNFSTMTGWVETNPKGWTIFEKDYDSDYVVPAGESYILDTAQKPESGQIMFQVGNPDEALVRRMQGYYAGYKGSADGFERVKEIADGVYEFTLREGAKISTGEKLRIYLPDTAEHTGPLNFMEMKNGSKLNGGAATLKLEKDRNINMHLYKEGKKGSFKLKYTLADGTESELDFTPKTLWNYNDKDKVMAGLPNKATVSTGGNFWIDTKKLKPGTDIVVESYDENGIKQENLTSYFRYINLNKSDEKYTNLAWVDHTEDLSQIGIEKSTYVPYQDIYTNDYAEGTDDWYKDPRVETDSTKFMTKTTNILGFSKYEGAKVRMRYINPENITYVGKADAESNEYNKDGEIVGKDVTKVVNVNGTDYDAYLYDINLAQLSEFKDGSGMTGGFELKKDMKLIFNDSNGSALPSDWIESRVKTRVLFDTTDGAFADSKKQAIKVVPDNEKFFEEDGYAANGFEGAGANTATGDKFPEAPTAEGKTFLGWATETGKTKLGKTIVKAADYEALTDAEKFTSTTAVPTHAVVYAIWSEEKLVTFDANGGAFDDGNKTKTDDIADGVTPPTNPTLEGKEFKGWASTPGATQPEDGILNNVTAAKTVYAVWGDPVVQKDNEKYKAEYATTDPVKVGEAAQSNYPNFKKAEGGDAVKPQGTTFKLGEGAPTGATIDEKTGIVTYTPVEADAGKTVDIPVVVVYPDKSEQAATAKIAVEKDTKLDVKEPAKTEVKDPTALTEGEKQAVKDAIKEANKDLGLSDDDINVKADGSVVVTKDGKTGELKPDQTVTESKKLDVKEPAKTEVKDPAALSKEERDKVKEAVIKANPELKDEEITVNADGSVDVTKDGKTGSLRPDQTVTESKKLDVKEPAKTEVKDPAALTDDEKQAVKDAVKEANKDLGLTDNDIDVKADGSVVVTKDGKTGELKPEQTITESKTLDVKEPAKTEVKNPKALTEEEKQAVKDAIKDANKDLGLTDDDIDVKADGSVVVTKDGKTGELKPAQTVTADTTAPAKPTVVANDNGSVTVTPPADKDTDVVMITYTDEATGAEGTVAATKDDQGNWTLPKDSDLTIDAKTGVVTIPANKAKDNTEVKAVAQDAAGNTSEEAKATVAKADEPVVEKTQKPMVDTVNAGDKEITGRTEPNADVEITLPDGTKATGKADDTGKFTVTLPEGKEPKENDEIKVVATKEGKNPSDQEVKKVEAADRVYKTKWVQETKKGVITLKEEDGNHPDDDGVSDIEGYEFVRTDTKEEGNIVTITNVYRLQLASKFLGLDGKNIKEAELGYDKENPNKAEGYTFLFDEGTSTQEVVQGKKAYIINRIYAKNPEVVEVANPDNLTGLEQEAVKAKVKAANKDLKDDQIAVDNKGNVTITRGANTGQLSADVTVKKDTTAPAVPTVVANEDGSVTVTPPADKDTDVVMITYTDEVTGVEGTVAARKDDQGNWTLPKDSDLTIDPKTGVVTIPANKAKDNTEVKAVVQDAAGNTSEEAKATVATVDTKVKAPVIKDVYTDSIDVEGRGETGSSIIVTFPSGRQARTGVDQNGKWRASLPDGEVLEEGAVITAVAEKAGKEKSEEASTTVKQLVSTIDVKEPVKTKVKNPSALTDEEKQAVKDAIKEANKDLGLTDDDIDVKDDGSVVVTKDGKTGELKPEQTVEKKETIADRIKLVLPEKTAVDDVSNLTASEKIEVERKLVEKNLHQVKEFGNFRTAAGADGTTTVTFADGSSLEVPGTALVIAKDALDVKEPAKTEVKNPSALTDEEKQAVKDAIKEANKDLGLTDNDIDVKDDGSVVISKDGKTGNLTPAQTIREKATPPGTSGGGSSFIIPKDDKGTVEELKDHKAYIFGYEDGTVRPDGNIKRAEAAAMVARLMGYDLSDTSKPKFADTNGWYNNAINAVVKAGLMGGYEDGSFRPDAPITRAEFAKVIQKIDKQNTTDNLPFADVRGHWAYQAISQAYANGRISGYPDGSFKAERKITRAEAASILNAVFNRKVDKEGLAKIAAQTKHFPDLHEGQWYYYEMVEAINSHTYHRADQAKSESWKKLK